MRKRSFFFSGKATSSQQYVSQKGRCTKDPQAQDCRVPRCSSRGRAISSLFSHSFPWSSELRKRWLFAIRQADWSSFRFPNSTVACIEHVLTEMNFHEMLVPKSLWTLASLVLSGRRRLDTSWNWCSAILFARMSPKWEYEAHRGIERKRYACPHRRLWARWWGDSQQACCTLSSLHHRINLARNVMGVRNGS